MLFLSLIIAEGVLGQSNCEQGSGYIEIVGDADAPNLYGNELLLPAQAATTPQFLKISGVVNFTSDYTFAPGSDIIFTENSSGFRIDGATLKLDYARLRGCNKLWQGVEVISGARIVSSSSVFEDAAVALLLRNKAEILLKNNSFKKNACGILAIRETPNPNPISILVVSSDGLSGNIFDGSGQLLESISPSSLPGVVGASPTSSSFPFAGIWLHRVIGLTIGNDNHPANVFTEYGLNPGPTAQGITLYESSVTITNASFEKFGVYNSTNPVGEILARAVYAFSPSIVPTETIIKNCNFFKCSRDIRTIGTDLIAEDNYSQRSVISIMSSQQSTSQHAFRCQIRGNEIHEFEGFGIEVVVNKPIILDISDNKLTDSPELFGISPRRGINVTTSSLSTINLQGNQIANNRVETSSLFTGSLYGISLNKVSYLVVEENEIIGNPASSLQGALYGIILAPLSNGTRILYNNIRGAGIDYVIAAGLRLNESVNCVLRCNYMDDITVGALFLSNCDNTDLRENEFNFHDIGLGLGHPLFSASLNIIGIQTNKENRWYGSLSNIEAYAKNLSSAQGSIFEINSSNLNSFFWPFPRKIGTMNDNFTWFLPSAIGPEADETVIACFLTEPVPKFEARLADTDSKLLNEEYEAPFGQAALEWEARWQFADRLNRNPNLINVSPEVTHYYEHTYDEAYSSLNRVYQAYLNRWENAPSAALATARAEALRAAVEQRFALDAALSSYPVENVALHAQMLEADSIIAGLSMLLEDATVELNAQVGELVSDLLEELSGITVTEAYETDMKAVIHAFLLAHATEGELSDEQLNEMEAIANKCRLSGGYAVVLARTLFDPDAEYPQDAACGTEELSLNGLGSTISSDALSVFPNPAREVLNVSIGQSFESGTARVINAQGLIVAQFNLEVGEASLPLPALPNGLYFLEVQLDKQPSLYRSFIVNP